MKIGPCVIEWRKLELNRQHVELCLRKSAPVAVVAPVGESVSRSQANVPPHAVTKTIDSAASVTALKAATLEGLLFRNVAALVIGKPQRKRDHADVARNCWEADQARTFLLLKATLR